MKKSKTGQVKNGRSKGAWLAPSVEHAALDLKVVSSSAMLGVELTLKKSSGGSRVKLGLFRLEI